MRDVSAPRTRDDVLAALLLAALVAGGLVAHAAIVGPARAERAAALRDGSRTAPPPITAGGTAELQDRL